MLSWNLLFIMNAYVDSCYETVECGCKNIGDIFIMFLKDVCLQYFTTQWSSAVWTTARNGWLR